MWHPSTKLSFKRRPRGRCRGSALPIVLPIDSISASKAAHALWLCLVLVAACAHSAQVNFSRVTGYQLGTWTPSVVATHKAEK